MKSKKQLGKPIGRFTINRLEILSQDGKLKEKVNFSEKEIKQTYELMVLARKFDEVALKLQREGRMLTYAPIKGQEAQIGVALAMKKEDWLFPAFRENGALIARGMPLHTLYQIWMGDERGNSVPEGLNNFTIAVPVASQILHAAGASYSMKLKKEKTASVVFFGDGATSEGDFHEGLNFAGVFQLPCVFICQNNQWAISLPRSKQTRAKTLAQKAVAYEIEGIQIDGNDIFAVFLATKQALERAKAGKGPTLIEMETYRMADHTTSDDAARYRKEKELKEWAKKDPILRLQLYMKSKKLWTPAYEKHLQEKTNKQITDAVHKAENEKPADITDIFTYTYAEIPPSLKEQMDWIGEK